MTARRRRRAARASAPGGEGRLFGLVALLVTAGYASLLCARLSHVPALDARLLLPPLLYAAGLLAVHLAGVTVRSRRDPVLVTAALALAGIGMLLQWRLGTYGAASGVFGYPAQFVALVAGWAAFLGVWLALRGGRWKRLAGAGLPAWMLAVAVLGAIALFGRRFRGMMFLPGRVNPAEIVKVLLVVFLAAFFALYERTFRSGKPGPAGHGPRRVLVTFALLWAVPMALLAWQRDLGHMLLLNATALVLFVLVTGRWKTAAGVALALLAAAFAVFRGTGYGRARLMLWLDPFQDPTGRSWQVLRGLSALYAGGLAGTGFGAGAPHAVPVASSDFIYAVVGEETGFLGCGLVLGLYLVLVLRGYRVAYGCRDRFGFALGAGLATALAVQVLWNIGGVVKAVPLTGITLPFLSQGGSSLITSFVLLGLLAALSEDGCPAAPRARARPARRRRKTNPRR